MRRTGQHYKGRAKEDSNKEDSKTEEPAAVLEAKLKAVELQIRKYTNNNFQVRDIRRTGDIVGGLFMVEALTPFEVGETVQVSQSGAADGIYTVKTVTDSTFTVNESVRDAKDALITLVEYPIDVKLGAAKMIGWLLKAEAAGSGDKAAMPIQSETLSRYSVTYAADATEADLDAAFGVPKKLTAFLKGYKKARF